MTLATRASDTLTRQLVPTSRFALTLALLCLAAPPPSVIQPKSAACSRPTESEEDSRSQRPVQNEEHHASAFQVERRSVSLVAPFAAQRVVAALHCPRLCHTGIDAITVENGPGLRNGLGAPLLI